MLSAHVLAAKAEMQQVLETIDLSNAQAVEAFQALAECVRQMCWQDVASRDVIKLDLGQGAEVGSGGWVTISHAGGDVLHDLRAGIPLADGTVHMLRANYLLHYFHYEELLDLLKDCRRVLKPGAPFYIAVDNAGVFLRAYAQKQHMSPRSGWQPSPVTDTGALIDQVNYVAYMDAGRRYLFDEVNLVSTLRLAGFSDVQLRQHDSAIDGPVCCAQTVYAVARYVI